MEKVFILLSNAIDGATVRFLTIIAISTKTSTRLNDYKIL